MVTSIKVPRIPRSLIKPLTLKKNMKISLAVVAVLGMLCVLFVTTEAGKNGGHGGTVAKDGHVVLACWCGSQRDI